MYWLEQAETDVPAENDWLSAAEAVCLSAMRFPKRRAEWRLGRWTAKRALSVCLDVPAQPQVFKKLEIRAAPSGAPEAFFGNQPAAASISLSHRSGTALCAVAKSGAALGCDLEAIEPRSDAFVADYFGSEEQALVASASAEERPRLLALLWSAKESTLKALHEGLRLDTRCATVLPSAGWFESKGWSPLQVRYAPDRHAGGRCTADLYSEDQVFHGWWRLADNLLRTVVAASPLEPPIPLNTPAYLFDSASHGAEDRAEARCKP